MYGDSVPLDQNTQEALDEAFRLLPRVPEYLFLLRASLKIVYLVLDRSWAGL